MDAATAGAQSLTVNTAGTTTFGAAVGGTNALPSLTTDSAGTTQIGANISTTGTQTYFDAVSLTGAAILASSGSGAAGNITLTSTVDGGFGLTVNTTGTSALNGAVGGTTPLASLTTNAGGSTAINTAGITTTGTQTYNDAVTLGTNAVINAGSGSRDIRPDRRWQLLAGGQYDWGDQFPRVPWAAERTKHSR